MRLQWVTSERRLFAEQTIGTLNRLLGLGIKMGEKSEKAFFAERTMGTLNRLLGLGD